MYGGNGNDRLFGASGDDVIEGGPGDDRMQGASGNDRLSGDAGNDTMYGKAGADEMYGGAGDDLMYAADGNDTLFGEAGDDRLLGAGGDDVMYGGDVIVGGHNTDICYGGPSDCEGPASNMAGLEALWASARADIVEEITTAGYGVTNGVLRGPAGFEVNLADCPADWSETAGIAGDTVTVSHTLAQTGSLAAYGRIGEGFASYVDYVNGNGGIGPDGLIVNLRLFDDEYVATTTQTIVDGVLAANDSFWVTNLGSPTTFAVRDRLNDACVPQPFVASAYQAWGDPENYPWTTGLQLSYAAEAHLWVEWIEENLAAEAPVSVAAFVMNNDFGLAYEQAFETRAEQSSVVGSVRFVRHDPAGTDFSNEIATLAAEDPDVYISMTAGNPCVLAMQEVHAVGLTSSALAVFTPSVCKAGAAADGWLMVGTGLKDFSDLTNPFAAFVDDTLGAAGFDTSDGLPNSGFGVYGWAHIEALRIAAELPGGLTRTNFMLAIRSLDLFHPMLMDGVAFEMNGALDAYAVEGAAVYRFDAAAQWWAPAGDVIDLNGQMPNCIWQPGQGC